MNKTFSVILAIALIVAIVYSVIITGDRNTLNTELESVQSVLSTTQAQLTSTKQSLASTKQTLASTQAELTSTNQRLTSTQAELTSTKQTLASMNQKLSSIQNDLLATKTKMDAIDAKLKLYEDTMGIKIYSGVQPRIQRGDLSIMHLNNTTTASNPSWQQLISFLLADSTDDKYYSEDSFDCVDFAEMLHNNAEAAGIKSAFVAVRFKNDPVGHTLNAFKTTDRGLVYVDNTGGKQFDASLQRDTIAYVVKGKEYGAISLGQNTPLDYAYYEKMQADSKSYDQKLAAYNRDVQTYNAVYEAEQRRRASLTPQQRKAALTPAERLAEEVAERLRRIRALGKPLGVNVYDIGTPEWFQFMETSLKEQKRVLDSLRAQLEDMWEPMGIVERIEIWW